MLARVGNSLYWIGRYIERSEHLARYLKVQYFSTFDAPMTQQKEVILRSILHMSTIDFEEKGQRQEQIQEQEVLIEVAFNQENTTSIYSSVQAARENARSVRYLISSELWEVINKYYHYVKGYSVDFYKTRGLHDFTTNVIQHCSIIRSYADSTLLHDDVWAFLELGIYLERAAQIIRILSNKIIDVKSLTNSGANDPLTAYQWTTTLKVLETFDMYRRLYKGATNQENVVTFLLTNPTLSRSVAFTLEKLNDFLSCLTFATSSDSNLKFQAGKLANSFKFLEYNEVEENLQEFLLTSLNKIYMLNDLIEKEYFE